MAFISEEVDHKFCLIIAYTHDTRIIDGSKIKIKKLTKKIEQYITLQNIQEHAEQYNEAMAKNEGTQDDLARIMNDAKLSYLQKKYDLMSTGNFIHDWAIIGFCLADEYEFTDLQGTKNTSEEKWNKTRSINAKKWTHRNIKRAIYVTAFKTIISTALTRDFQDGNIKYKPSDLDILRVIQQSGSEEHDEYYDVYSDLRSILDIKIDEHDVNLEADFRSSVSSGRAFLRALNIDGL